MTIGDILLVVVASVVIVPTAILTIEALAALFPGRFRSAPILERRPKIAILIPAHNEAAGISRTLEAVQSQLREGDRIVVVADNCEDATAETARMLGVEAIERQDTDRRGKGYALAFGLRHLAENPPEIVIIIDADTRSLSGAIDALIHTCKTSGQPAQGIFTDGPRERGPREQWSAFALVFKNHIRPLGLHRLGLPCLLTGSGMAFPWNALNDVEVGRGNIVEDMQLGIDLALAGHTPAFCPQARFESDDAPNLQATLTRRTRWEHGHVRTAITQTPRLFLAGLLRFRPKLLALACELSVPPLSLVAMLQLVILTIAGIWWKSGGSDLPVLILLSGMSVATLAILLSWWKFGRSMLSPKILCLLPVYVLWKLPIYLKMLITPQRNWVRTERKTTQ